MRKPRGPNGDQSGNGSRSRSSITPSCTAAPGRASTSSSFQSKLLRLALDDRDAEPVEHRADDATANPTTSTSAVGWRRSTSAIARRSRSSVMSEGLNM